MKILFISDTHGELKEKFKNIDFTWVELIVFLWDNETGDLELFRDIDIKKVWFLWNHTPREKTRVKIDIFTEFGIEDISWKEFKFKGIKFFGIPGEIRYIISEEIMKWQSVIPSLDNTKTHIQDLKNKIEILQKSKPDIILSHFPAFGIMDKPKDFAHRWLHFLSEYINANSPKYLIHGHLHMDKSVKVNKTKVQQVFLYKILDI